MNLGNRLNWYWRLAATGLAFLVFFPGALLLGLPGFLFLRLVPIGKRRRRSLGQRMVHLSFRFWVSMWRFLGLLTWEVEGAEDLRAPGQLIIANHPTLIDVVLLISLIPETSCVVKQALWRNPLTWAMVSAACYIRNDQGPSLVANCVEALRSGNSLLVFPEGTRSRPGESPSIQRGAANIALRAGVPLRVVHIWCEPVAMFKGEPWYRIPLRRIHFRIRVLKSIESTPLLAGGRPIASAARQLTREIEALFQKHPGSDVPLNK